MTGEEILKSVRGLLDDEEEDYLWKDSELCDYLNQAVTDFVKGTRILGDVSTTTICQIKLLSNLGIYSIDRSILTIDSGRLVACPIPPLALKSRAVLDDTFPNWRTATGTPRFLVTALESLAVCKVQFVPRYYPDLTGEVLGNANISFDAATKKISMAAGVFTTHYATGDTFNVSGTTLNNGYLTVVTVADTEIVVAETLVDELNTSAVLRQVEDTAELDVTRVPVTEFTLSNLKTKEPEFPWIYHRDLFNGIRGYAYGKQDADTHDPKASDKYLDKFFMSIEITKRDLVRRKSTRHILTPHPGTI
jgi:hypothetical protein